jgi:hypothetical protein
VVDRSDDAADRFLWRFGDTDVTVTWESPVWVVRLHATSRLAGPGALVSKRDYQQATHAAYAVMTHVQRITLSEEEGVNQGRLAARWMRSRTAKPADPKRS